MAAVVMQHADQPIVEATDFNDRDEVISVLKPFTSELLEESVDLLWFR